MKINSCFFLFLLLLIGFTKSQVIANPVQLFGSDLLTPWLPQWVEGSELENASNYEFKLTGSYSGLIALRHDYADGCLYLNPNSDKPEIPKGFQSTPIAYLAIYVYAPESFPANSISMDVVRSMAQSNNSISTWGDYLEAPELWSDKPISIILNSGYLSIAESLFLSTFSSNGDISQAFVATNDSETILSQQNKSPYYLLFTPIKKQLEPDSGLKLLSIVGFGDQVAFPPTAENIRYRDYGLSYPIDLIYPQNAEWAKRFINWIKLESSAEILAANQIISAK